MNKDEKKKAGAVVAAAIILALFLCRKVKGAPPTPPPGLAVLWGHVTAAQTGDPIEGVEVACDSYFAITDSGGYYEIQDIEPGIYTLTFTDPLGRYASLVV